MTELIERVLGANREHATRYFRPGLPRPPAQHLAVVTCMDARIDVFGALGLDIGDAHVIRNAGGVVSEDALRSLVVSQRFLGTEEVYVIMHTDCGMATFTESQLKAELREETGEEPPFSFHTFTDLEEEVRLSVDRVRESRFIQHRDRVRGFIYDVNDGLLKEIET